MLIGRDWAVELARCKPADATLGGGPAGGGGIGERVAGIMRGSGGSLVSTGGGRLDSSSYTRPWPPGAALYGWRSRSMGCGVGPPERSSIAQSVGMVLYGLRSRSIFEGAYGGSEVNEASEGRGDGAR